MKVIALFCLVLAGCGSTVDVQRVEIPVAVPCVKASSIPAEPESRFASLPDDAPLDDSVKALLIDREGDKMYGRRLRAIADNCASDDRLQPAGPSLHGGPHLRFVDGAVVKD